MINILELKDINKNKWNSLVKTKGTKSEELYEYADLMEKEGYKARFFILEDYKAGMIFYEKKEKINKIKAMPPIGNDKDSLELLEEYKRYSRKHAPFYNYITPDRFIPLLVDLKGFYRNSLSTIEIPIRESLDKLWLRLDKKARWGVNKAKKEGAQIIEASTEKEVEEFYKIYEETCKRGNISPVSLNFLKGLFNNLKDYNHLLLVRYKNKYIAGSWIKIYGKDFLCPKQEYNASLTEYLEIQPNNLLYWAMIEWVKNHGYPVLDLGGIEPEAGEGSKLDNLNKFKQRWAGEQKDYYVYSSSFIYHKFFDPAKKDSFLGKLVKKLT